MQNISVASMASKSVDGRANASPQSLLFGDGHNKNGIGSHVFKGVEYLIRIAVEQRTLLVSVEERFTCEMWRGEFEANYLEELAKKTGNFKTFDTFNRMLSAAVGKTNNSVRLDLLTYSDLETLRKKRSHPLDTSFANQSTSLSMSTKRYLIMTFTSEFDSIHYPLPLVYGGKPDPSRLQGIIRDLHAQLAQLKSQAMQSNTAVSQLQTHLDTSVEHSRGLESQVKSLKHQLDENNSLLASAAAASAKEERGSRRSKAGRTITREDLQVLKQIITKLESDLITERTKYQRQLQKKQAQIKQLEAENKDLRDSERNLQIRCRNLSGEASIRSRARTGRSTKPSPKRRTPSNERKSLVDAAESLTRSAERLSRGDKPKVRLVGRAYSRSPSPGRFDPTEYVRAREEKLQAARLAREAERRRQRSPSPHSRGQNGRGRSPAARGRSPAEPARAKQNIRSRSKSADTTKSKTVSNGNVNRSRSRPRSRESPNRITNSSSQSGTQLMLMHSNSKSQDNDISTNSKYFQRNVEITDIDARLDALHQFLQSAQTAH